VELSRLWIGMLTRDQEDAGTDSEITLSITSQGIEQLFHTFPDTTQEDQERAQANLYSIDVAGRGIATEMFSDSSIRIGIRGDDAWRPEHILVWGEGVTPSGSGVTPLAMESDITTQLSTDADEGPTSMPLRLVAPGGNAMLIRRLLMLMVTNGTSDEDVIQLNSGTDDPLEIQIVTQNGLAALYQIANTSQEDLENGVANFYAAPVIVPFARRELDDTSITLRIKGMKEWSPARFFLFGVDTPTGRPNLIVPLVHEPEWSLGRIRPDPTMGAASVTLPLLPSRRRVEDPLFGLLLRVAFGQETLIERMDRLLAKVEGAKAADPADY
jgi:hypothetical protein